MNPGARPQERQAVDDLEAELGALGAMLRSSPLPDPPPACEAAIRAAAQDAAGRKRQGGGRWSGVLAMAATVSLAVGIGWHAARDPRVAPAPVDPRSAAAAVAPAPDSGARQADPAPATLSMEAAESRASPTLAAAPSPPPAPVALAPVFEAAPVAVADSTAASAPAATQGTARAAAAGTRPDPVAWLGRIDALRAAGRTDEAAREEALLDASWPGWRAAHVPDR